MFYQNRNIFNILFEAIPEGVIIVNENMLITAANNSAELMFEYNPGELKDQNLNVLIPSKYHLNHKNHFSKFIKNKNIRKISHELNLFAVKKNKKEFPVEIGINPFTVNNETFILALIIDISSRKENEHKIDNLNFQLEKKIALRNSELNNTINQLKKLNYNYKEEIKKRKEAENNIKNALKKEQELNELKTKFLSMVSHEFKTPLSGILTSAMLLNKYKLSQQQEKRDKHIKTIESKVHYLNNILNDFLSIERLDSSKVNYKFTTFNLSKVTNEVVYNANMLLKSGQRIIIPKNSDDFVLQQDEKILELILSNLIYNAVKYSPENTNIELEIIKNGKSIIFNIIDEGIGIPLNDQKFIFNRYFRAENVLNTQGTGIGLNIVKAHLESLGGSISFTSEVNKGSVFTVKLPLNST